MSDIELKPCPNCEGINFEWFIDTVNTGLAVDGRLKSNEISAIAVQGCLDCSETVRILREPEIVKILENTRHESSKVERIREYVAKLLADEVDNMFFSQTDTLSRLLKFIDSLEDK